MPIVLKSESLSFLETSEPVQACLGIALPFTEDTENAKLHTSITLSTQCCDKEDYTLHCN